jgi:hypothetical protein
MSQTLPSVSTNTSDSPPGWTPSGEGTAIVPIWERSYTWHGDSRRTAGPSLFIGLVILAAGAFIEAIFLHAGPVPDKTMLFLIGLIWLCTGFALFSNGMFILFNSTTLRLSKGWLQIHTGPLPWPRTRSLPARQIRSLEIGHKQGTHLLNTGGGDITTHYNYYRLSAHLASGGTEVLLDKFTDPGPLKRAAAELRRVLYL